MTRKHYRELARAYAFLRPSGPQMRGLWKKMIQSTVLVLRAENPAFSEDLFWDAINREVKE